MLSRPKLTLFGILIVFSLMIYRISPDVKIIIVKSFIRYDYLTTNEQTHSKNYVFS